MKCTTCGFPLSPTNTNMPCPRCHTSTNSNSKFVVQQQISFPFPEQAPFPQSGQLVQSATTPAPINMQAELHQNRTPYGATNRTPEAIYSALSTPTPALRPQTRHASNLGFIVAGLCVFTGGLILILVYFMAIGLPPSSSASSYTTAPVVTKNTPSALLTAVPSPKIVPSITAGAFPGQQYLVNPRMASNVNMTTAQPLQATTTFKVNQKIYVTFDIHPNNKNGAICLYWYLNNKNVTQFPFSVTANAKAGYSYAIYGGAGAAFVEIYWASSTTCSDKLLAQHVNFTVTP